MCDTRVEMHFMQNASFDGFDPVFMTPVALIF